MNSSNLKSQLRLKVADIIIQVQSAQDYVGFYARSPHDRFMAEDGEPDCVIDVSYGSVPRLDGLNKLFDSGGNWSMHYGAGKYVVPLVSPATGPEPYRLAVFDEDFRKGTLYIRPYRQDMPSLDKAADDGVGIEPFEYPLDELVVVNLLARGRGLNVHGCGVASEKGGLVFCGVSGAGKSTIAELWKQRHTQILSDDRLILRIQDGAFCVHGTPWHGDAKVAVPVKKALKALYFIKHAPENRIVPLKPTDAATRLLVRCFPTFYYPEGMDYTLQFISQLTREVPCLELGFVPDQSVIDLVLNNVPAFASTM